jgi:hypothetical protein
MTGPICYLVVIAKEGIDINQVADDGGLRDTSQSAVEVENESGMPGGYIVAYPNPFNPETKIAFSCQSRPGGTVNRIDVDIFGTNGKLVEKLKADSQKLKAGITWKAATYPSGIYIARIQLDGKVITKKLILSK